MNSKKKHKNNKVVTTSNKLKTNNLYAEGGSVNILNAIAGGAGTIVDASMANANVDTTQADNAIEAIRSFQPSTASLNALNSGFNSVGTANTDHDYKDYTVSTGEGIANMGRSGLMGFTSGLQAGGIWGGIAGLAVGLGASGGAWAAGVNKAKREAQRLNREANMANISKYNRAEAARDTYHENTYNNARMNYVAYGGPIFNHSGDWSNGITFINEGGTHEENPFGGVPVGVDQEGIPNLVEEGEIIYNDYVFSNRLKPTKKQLELYGFNNKYINWSFAKIVEDLQKISSETPNDHISIESLDDMMNTMIKLQEEIRMRKQKRQYNSFDGGGALPTIDPAVVEAIRRAAAATVVPTTPSITGGEGLAAAVQSIISSPGSTNTVSNRKVNKTSTASNHNNATPSGSTNIASRATTSPLPAMDPRFIESVNRAAGIVSVNGSERLTEAVQSIINSPSGISPSLPTLPTISPTKPITGSERLEAEVNARLNPVSPSVGGGISTGGGEGGGTSGGGGGTGGGGKRGRGKRDEVDDGEFGSSSTKYNKIGMLLPTMVNLGSTIYNAVKPVDKSNLIAAQSHRKRPLANFERINIQPKLELVDENALVSPIINRGSAAINEIQNTAQTANQALTNISNMTHNTQTATGDALLKAAQTNYERTQDFNKLVADIQRANSSIDQAEFASNASIYKDIADAEIRDALGYEQLQQLKGEALNTSMNSLTQGIADLTRQNMEWEWVKEHPDSAIVQLGSSSAYGGMLTKKKRRK